MAEVCLTHLRVQLLLGDTILVLELRQVAVGLAELLFLVCQTVLNVLVAIEQRQQTFFCLFKFGVLRVRSCMPSIR